MPSRDAFASAKVAGLAASAGPDPGAVAAAVAGAQPPLPDGAAKSAVARPAFASLSAWRMSHSRTAGLRDRITTPHQDNDKAGQPPSQQRKAGPDRDGRARSGDAREGHGEAELLESAGWRTLAVIAAGGWAGGTGRQVEPR